jgi:Tol biopolymer transport system component
MTTRVSWCALFVGLACAGGALGQITVRSSVAGFSGLEGDAASIAPAVSADGRFVAFESDAANLVSGDVNGARDVFLRDAYEGTTILVSLAANGFPSNGRSSAPAISADGRHVAFVSEATNLVAGENSGERRVYVRDTWVRGALAVAPFLPLTSYDASEPAISADGRWIAATVARDSVRSQIVVLDRDADGDGAFDEPGAVATLLVSATPSNAPGNGPSYTPSISGDGRLVAFASEASDLVVGDVGGFGDVFVRDLVTRATRRASVTAAGAGGGGHSGGHAGGTIRFGVSLSRDGRSVAFGSEADDLVAGDGNGLVDVFVRNLVQNRTARVSVATDGSAADGASTFPSISGNGRFVAFTSLARTLLSQDANEAADVFVRDRDVNGDGTLDQLGDVATERASVGAANEEANAASGRFSGPAISDDGAVVAFDSGATNLVPGDANAAVDVFARDRRRCADSTVNSSGIVANVLRMNQSLGADPGHVVLASVGEPVSMRLNASPVGPEPARYALWVWAGEPTNYSRLEIAGTNLGCTVNPTPFATSGRLAPRLCLLGGFGPEYCGGVPVAGAPARAPWYRVRDRGISRPVTFTVQGVIEDAGTITARRLGITNAVTLRVR